MRVTSTPAQHGPAHLSRGAVSGFVVQFADSPDDNLYFSDDTVWFDGVAEVARRFSIPIAVLNLGPARVAAVGPLPLTMTAEDAVRTAHAFPDATIVPLAL